MGGWNKGLSLVQFMGVGRLDVQGMVDNRQNLEAE